MSKNIVFSKNAGMKSQIFFQRGVKFPKSSPIYLTSKANKTFAYRTSSESKVSHAGETEDNGDEGNRMCELEADIAKANNGAQGSARQFKEEYIMVVQHNLRAMNSNRMLGLTTASQSKSTEKLSSGYKINRAADDAAGLSISEKMRRQIRGLTQASANAEDGISAVQTAEGALNEVQDMLQRINELAVKGENGTLTTQDRSYIGSEVSQLMTEIDRVKQTTTFNEKSLLNGEFNANLQVGAESTDKNKINVTIKNMSVASLATTFDTKKVGTNASKLDAATVVARFQNFASKTSAEKIQDGIRLEASSFAALNVWAKAAIQDVSEQRSDLGAIQNRLEHTINNLDNIVENTTSAESAIRDTDMATEMVKYSNNNILAQAGQAMLAQSNQANQGVLSLLQ